MSSCERQAHMICRVVSWIRLSGRVPLRPAPFRFLRSTHSALNHLLCPNLLQTALFAVPHPHALPAVRSHAHMRLWKSQKFDKKVSGFWDPQ